MNGWLCPLLDYCIMFACLPLALVCYRRCLEQKYSRESQSLASQDKIFGPSHKAQSGNRHAVLLAEVHMDSPVAHATGIQGNDLMIKAGETALVFGNQRWIKSAMAVTRNGESPLTLLASSLCTVFWLEPLR